MDRGALRATVHGIAKSQMTKQLHFQYINIHFWKVMTQYCKSRYT